MLPPTSDSGLHDIGQQQEIWISARHEHGRQTMVKPDISRPYDRAIRAPFRDSQTKLVSPKCPMRSSTTPA